MPFAASRFRAEARKCLQNHWQTALLIALVVNLPTLLVQAITSFTGNDPLARLDASVIALSRDGSLTDAALLAAADELLHSTGIWVMAGLSVVAWLVTPCLSLGMNHWILDRLRAKEGGVESVFSRVRIFWKAIGLRLFTALLVLLWMLPGMVLMFGGTLLLAGNPAALAGSSGSTALSAVMLAGTLAMLIPGVMASLRYALADFLMADAPERGVRSCVQESASRMKGRLGSLLSLFLSFLLWYLLELLVTSLVLSFFGQVAALVVQMLCSLALSVYLQTAVGAFHEALAR